MDHLRNSNGMQQNRHGVDRWSLSIWPSPQEEHDDDDNDGEGKEEEEEKGEEKGFPYSAQSPIAMSPGYRSEPKEKHIPAALCPTEALCRGSLLCAIAADDAHAVRRILSHRRGQLLERGLCDAAAAADQDFDDLMENSPCRIFYSLSYPGRIMPVASDCFSATPAKVAVLSGAQRALALFLPEVMGRPSWPERMYNLLHIAISAMGQIVWMGRFSGLDKLQPRGAFPVATAIDLDRAASAITWRGEASSIPSLPPRILRQEPMLEEASRRNGMLWTVEVYDAPAVIDVLLRGASALAKQPYRVNPLEILRTTMQTFVSQLVLWADRLYDAGYRSSSLNRKDSTHVRSLPRGYRNLLDDLKPLYTTAAPHDEEEYRQFLDMLREVRETLATHVLHLTRWPEVLTVLLDAGFDPRDRAVYYSPVTVGQRLSQSIESLRPSIGLSRHLFSYEEIASRHIPSQRPTEYWMGEPVILSILGEMDAIYAHQTE